MISKVFALMDSVVAMFWWFVVIIKGLANVLQEQHEEALSYYFVFSPLSRAVLLPTLRALNHPWKLKSPSLGFFGSHEIGQINKFFDKITP